MLRWQREKINCRFCGKIFSPKSVYAWYERECFLCEIKRARREIVFEIEMFRKDNLLRRVGLSLKKYEKIKRRIYEEECS